jgi:N-acetylneuraminic acid mutarotase
VEIMKASAARRPALLALPAAATVILILLAAPAATGVTAQHRINAGGLQVTGTPVWAEDTSTSPSQYVNTAAAGNNTFSTTQAIDMTHPSVPAGTPASIFQTERWDPVGAAEMMWSFPVSPGGYQVRLYFAEIYSGTQNAGARVFDVSIEGAVVLNDYDIFADVGGYKGVVKSFFVTTDSTLDIDFGHVVENPKVSAIEILPGTRPNEVGATPGQLDFGPIAVGTTQSNFVQLTNLGASGDPPIVIESTTMTGPNAAAFSDSFDDSASITLAPGESTTVSVTFKPTSTGGKAATLAVSHSGTNTPLNLPLAGSGTTQTLPGTWETRAPSGLARQEVSYVHAGGKFYLAGAGTAHQAYNPATNSWSNVAPLPAALDHIQGVELGGKIYYIGGLVSWPSPEVNTVYIYNPATNNFTQGANMPRGRGAGGTAVFDGKIYYAGGLNGGVAVPWFDVYNPSTNTWSQLPDMPTARDHFHAAVVNGKLYAIGGRNKDINATTTANQAYDIANGTWQTGLAPLPTPRGGFASAALGDEVLIIGGEGGGNTFATVEAYNTVTNNWRTLTSMPTARHGIQAAVCNGGVYIAGGGKTQGGGGATDVHEVFFLGSPTPCGAAPIGFGKSLLSGTSSSAPTSLEFGPDGRLYVAHQNGVIKVYTISRQAANSYAVTATDTITSIQSIPNHNDNGAVNTAVAGRQVTGILVRGTATNPVIYVSSSDPRIGGGSSGTETGLDTNSSTISRLTWNGTTWQKVDLVRGLPRSEENHSVNGMQLDPATQTLYVTAGGNTNQGAPSNNFALLPEFALSAAILSIDLNAIGSTTYDLPTLDDENRTGADDANDPFGGNDGKNQAKLVPGGPVKVHAPGFRNPYDVVITASGRMYTIDNGANAGWGGVPKSEGPAGICTNEVSEPGTTDPDELHFVLTAGYYGGHPNPTRGNKANTFNADEQSPVGTANPIECDYLTPGAGRKALATWPASTNGLAEYKASNFGGAMTGDLLAASFDNTVYRIKLNSAGDAALSNQPLFSTVGNTPLDVTATGSSGNFPGTIWVADHGLGKIHVFEPNDFGGGGGEPCTGANNPTIDEDADGYKNADEIDNGTDPCSAADVPPDWDTDKISNLNDPNDDNDASPDTSDPFAIDPVNGTGTTLPTRYTWDNDAPPAGGLLGLGFTGLMTNNTSNYETLFNPAKMTAGGAAGATTVDTVPEGDALASSNTQQYGFQFGVQAPATKFNVHTRILAPFSGLQPEDHQSMGLVLGNGDQDNYVKLVTSANGGAGGVEFVKEVGGSVTTRPQASVGMPGPDHVDLFLTVDPVAATVQPTYSVTTNGVTGPRIDVGAPEPIPSTWLNDTNQGLAVGIISTSRGAGPEFPATWDLIEVVEGDASANDATAPTVTAVAPQEDATNVAASTNVSATFSEPVDPATLSSATFTLVKQGTTSPVAATVTYLSASKTVRLDPNANLEAGATYMATLKGGPGGVKDVAGNPLAADKVWTFAVSSSKPPSASDTFTRSLSGGWGSADVGGAWTTSAGSASNFAVNGTTGTVLTPAGSVQQVAHLGSVFVRDVDAAIETTFAGLPSTGSFFSYLLVRGQAGGGYYRVGVYVTPFGKLFIRGQTNAGSALFPDVDTGLVLSAPETVLLRVQAEGTSPTAVRARAWKRGTTEPTAWQATASSSTTGLQGAGWIGVRAINTDGTVTTLSFDDLTATELSPAADTTAPTVNSVSPSEGATNAAVSTNVSAVFSEALDPATVSAATFTLMKGGTSSAVPAVLSYNTSSQTALLDPDSDLDAGSTYTATVKGGPTGVKDLAGNPLAADKVWSFTVTAADTTAPTVNSVSPNEGATGVNPTTKVTATFSEALDPATMSSSTFTLVKAGTAMAVVATVTYDVASHVATLRPSSKLAAGVVYTAKVKGGASGVKDLAGNPAAADKLWSFTVRGRIIPSVWIGTATVNVAANGGARILLRCRATAGGCRGSITLAFRTGAPRPRAGRRPRLAVRLGSGSFRLRAGERRHASVRLTLRGFARLRARFQLSVRAVVVSRDAFGHRTTTARLIVLRTPRKPR